MSYANINNVKEAVFRISNKQQKGAITDIDFNRFASVAQLEIVNMLFEKRNRYYKQQLRFMPRIDGITDIQYIDDILQPLHIDMYQMLFNGNDFEYPSDVLTIDAVIVNGQNVEIMDSSKYFRAASSSLTQPSVFNHVAVRKSKALLSVYPAPVSPDEAVILSYWKKPQGVDFSGEPVAQSPTWAATLVGNNLVYNPTNSINFELGVGAENMLIRKILEYVGVSLSHEDIVGYMMQERDRAAQEINITNQTIS
jgi:hypothetical protein